MTELDPESLAADLARDGYAVRKLLDPATCRVLEALYDRPTTFRKRIVMEHHGYGRGEYQYFAYPLPPEVAELRTALYAPLAVVANQWRRALGQDEIFPEHLDEYLACCHAAGQNRPTPLMLRYDKDGFNCLHQDLYGDLVFPMQAVILLSDPDRDFTGGAFMLVEQRPRAQSKGEVVYLRQGEAAIFPVRDRPVRGARGYHRTVMRHGVSRVLSGRRHTLGLIFHDAA